MSANAAPAAQSRLRRIGGRRDLYNHRRLGQAAKWLSCPVSIVVAAAFLLHVFGAGPVIDAASDANIRWLFGAICLGALIQAVRAQRARYLLRHDRSVSFFQSYAAMVVGHGIGDLVPLAPGGPVLRSLLTQRLTGIPVAFSTGGYMVEGALDVISPAMLIPVPLLMMELPRWTDWVLVGLAIQAMLVPTLLIAFATRRWTRLWQWLPARFANGLRHLTRQGTDGLRAVASGGPRNCLLVTASSLLLLALTAGQLTLLLHAFALGGSATGLSLLLVAMLSAGSAPVKIPAFGTFTAAAALPLAGIRGPDIGGYLAVSQFLLSSQTVLLAAIVVGWWLARGIWPLGRVKA